MIEWFDSLIAEGEAGIDRLVAERTQETVHLDFKEKADASHGAFADGDKRTLAKALSAFSNSAGGLLIFGIEARKGQDGIDCAQTAKPLTNIAIFQSQATGLVGQLLQPKHDGIRLASIPSGVAGSGYLLIAVDRSERRPHRSEAAGQRQYFKRAGDSSFPREHYDIEDAFRRRSAPILEAYTSFGQGGAQSSEIEVTPVVPVEIFLKNVGYLSAVNPYVATPLEIDYNFNKANGLGIGIRAHGDLRFFERPSEIVHPSTTKMIAPLQIPLQAVKRNNIWMMVGDNLKRITVHFGCQDGPMMTEEYLFKRDELAKMTSLPEYIRFI